MIEPMTYFGTFWIPNNEGKRMFGTYTYKEDGSSIIEIHRCDYEGTFFSLPPKYGVLWGEIADGYPMTFFDVTPMGKRGESYYLFYSKYVLTKYHVQSLDDELFDRCFVKFNHLNAWVRKNTFEINYGTSEITYISNHDETVISSDIILDDNLSASICSLVLDSIIPFYSCKLTQETYFRLYAQSCKSIGCFIELITEITQFVSVALLSKQYPDKILFGDDIRLLVNNKESEKPTHILIPFELLKDRVPILLNNWHKYYSDISPLCTRYLNSLNQSDFDTPDFLLIATSLDGFYRRFISNDDGISYKSRLDKLIEKFKDIDAVKEYSIDTEVFKDSRNKYAHLLPESEAPKAVFGKELYILTQKGVILLTCCFLNLLGLNNEEINICCKNARLRNRLNIL